MVETIQIPVEYFITTTSDWTTFQIMEGGWWSDVEVKCMEGCDRLTKGILHNEDTVSISKKHYDARKVAVYISCTLNIDRSYLFSDIIYLITKGDIESTDVKVVVAGTEQHNMGNWSNDPTDWRNPFVFNVPVLRYIKALEKKKDKKTKKPKEKIEAQQEKPHEITQTFNKMFKEKFQKEEPNEKDVEEVFGFLRVNGENATKFLEADICRRLTFQAQTHFWRFPNLKKKVSSEAKKTLGNIKKRFDELRKIEGKITVQTPYGGIKKEQKKVAPNK